MTEQVRLAQTLDIYASSWGPLTGDARMAAFATCLHEDFVYTDPNIRTVGYDELATYMDAFQQQVPGGGFVNRDIADHHDALLVHWEMTGPDGTVLSPGASFGTVHPDGRLASMTGFYAQ
jgi:SnoaL-like domain